MAWTIYLIHHTHTDVGYTEVQGRILDRQVDFIRQALELVEADGRFRWTCETFWAAERFLAAASGEERERFVRAVRAGRIGLSASYLNFSELLDYDTHRALARRVRDFGEAHGLIVRSAMTADINGHSLGFAQALCDHGVEQLFACVHTYHGMYPLARNQTPFRWRMPDGRRLLVWSGDHYHLGNELGLVPGAFMTHMVRDAATPGEPGLDVAARRVPAYLEKLRAEGYPYDFVPLMISGLMTDNAPPAPTVTGFVDAWNERHGARIRLELSTLDGFFDRLRAAEGEIPEYDGLWPDWWADLLGSAPAAVQLFREGQRQLALYRGLAARRPDAAAPGDPAVEQVEDALALYAEHTFGHSAAYTHPDHLLVAACALRKSGMAAEAYEGAQRLMDRATARLGGARFRAGRPLRFRVVNPYETAWTGIASLDLDGFEWGSVDVRFEPASGPPATVPGVRVADAATGEPFPTQASFVPRGLRAQALLTLEPGGERTLEVRPEEPPRTEFLKVSAVQGIDRARDVRHEAAFTAGEFFLETPFVRVEWDEAGVRSWLDRRSGQELLDPARPHPALALVHELSPGSPRTPMGRNRKSPGVVRSPGRVTGVRGTDEGELFGTVALELHVEGTRSAALLLRAHRDRPLVEVEVSLHKETNRDVESLYLALPFTAGPEAELWMDTTVRPLRPWRDQLPGTLTDFFHVGHGFGSAAPGFGVGVAMPDTPLLQLGDLRAKPRLLAGAPELEREPRHPYAWVMNNFWETNAPIDLAGFYRFRYAVFWGPAAASPEALVESCRRLNQGAVTFRAE